MNEPSVLLELRQVTRHYSSGSAENGISVLRGVDLRLHRGDAVAIVGPSGSGKSTLLNIIGTLERCTSGSVVLDGQSLENLDDLEQARIRNLQIGFIFQAHHLLPQCNVLENVLVPTLALRSCSLRSEAEARARHLLERVGLQNRLTHRPAQLSGGERQRVAVVRALINQPKLLLADEPTGALDRASAINLAELLVGLNREQSVTLIVVTHALDLAGRMGRVFELRDGMLAQLTDSPSPTLVKADGIN